MIPQRSGSHIDLHVELLLPREGVSSHALRSLEFHKTHLDTLATCLPPKQQDDSEHHSLVKFLPALTRPSHLPQQYLEEQRIALPVLKLQEQRRGDRVGVFHEGQDKAHSLAHLGRRESVGQLGEVLNGEPDTVSSCGREAQPC